MRKIFKFLALLVVVFALPQWAHAWNGYGLDGEDNSTWAGLTWDNTEKCLKGSFENWNGKKIRVQAWSNNNSKSWFGYQTYTYGINGGNSYEVNITNSDANQFIISTNDKYDVKVYLENSTLGNNPNKIVFTKTNQGGVSAPAKLYIFSDKPSWATKKSEATPTTDGKFTYTISMTAGENFVLSTTSSSANGYDGLKPNIYTHGEGETILANGESSSFSTTNATNTGCWQAPVTGNYTITVDWSAGTLTATYEEKPVAAHLPLTSADFATDRSKKHYFLVGERMGEWRLQPEWEFKVEGDKLVLDNRYIYDGVFAIAVVDNYNDYARHNYDYYSPNPTTDTWNFNASTMACNDDFSGHKQRMSDTSKGTTRKPTKVFYADFQVAGDYWQGRGKFMSKITVGLKNGLPSTLQFTEGDVAAANENRMFTILGSEIYNSKYSNKSGEGTTPMWNKNNSDVNKNQILGWQEGWIQYDPNTNEPYVDANGEFLYHTSFTPDYLLKHSVPFSLTLSDGSNFTYSSDELQFVEASLLSDRDSDPYVDFYEAFNSTNERIYTGATRKGGEEATAYNFKVNVSTSDTNKDFTSTADWECYVVRDMWIAGEIKFWTGWGGNIDWTRGGTSGISTWHGPNGGPHSAHYQVKGFDVLGEDEAVVDLYRNVRNSQNNNYKISESNKPVYFNRVVLWLNNTDGVANSYIQFIQATAGPAIMARVATNENDAEKKENWIRYNWYIQKPADTGIAATEGAKEVVSYEISRYRLTDNNWEFTGYPEGEKVYIKDVTDEKVTVADLYDDLAGTTDKTKFVIHTDKGIIDDRGFSPGTYRYEIFVTYKNEDGTTVRKQAVSNRVYIYGDLAPEAVPMQLVELREAYTDAYEGDHVSAASVLKALDTNGKISDYTKYKYMTYRENSNDNFYVIEEIDTDADGNAVPKGVAMLDKGVGAAFFAGDNQDKYWWTSDYYLRCLDYNAYRSLLQGYIDGGMIGDTTVPEPTVEVFEIIDGGEGISRGKARLFEFGGKSYYSAIVKRGGNLSDGTFDVLLSYDFTNKNTNKVDTYTAQMGVDFGPVMPRPFNPVYRYVHERTSTVPGKVEDKRNFGKILVPTQNWKIENSVENSTTEAINKGLMKEAYVDLDDVNFAPRTFTLQVDFFRPNVDKEIYKFYDIHYHLDVTNTDESITKVPLDAKIELSDPKTADSELLNKYRIEIKGLHPRNVIFPTVDFVKTVYNPRVAVSESGEVFKSSTGNFGKMLTVKAAHKMAVEAGSGLQDVYLGWIKRSDGTIDWMYKGHKHLGDKEETIGADKTYEYADPNNEIELQPMYYLIELKKSDTDFYTYPYLVPHYANHRTEPEMTAPVIDKNTGLILNDSDPLIGTYIARGTDWADAPEVHATAIYMFERPVSGDSNTEAYDPDNFEFYGLKVVNMTLNDNDVTPSGKAAAAHAAPARISGSELVAGNAGKLPDAPLMSATEVALPTNSHVINLSAKDETTGYNGYVAVRGASYNYELDPENNVTGVEDVIADGENGESVYYNMQGMRIEKPETPGVYFRVDGKKVTKFVVK